MSGTIALPDCISVTQNVVGPRVEITQGTSVALPPGVPAYPLVSNPGRTWDLQDVNGVLTWVEFFRAPGQRAVALEDGLGVLLLEDGDGVLLMEA